MSLEILTAALVVVTAAYAWFTFRILETNRATVRAMEAQTAALTRPYLTVLAEPERGTTVFVLRIANVGKIVAEKVSLSVDNAFHQFGDPDKNIQSMKAFVQVIPSMSPGLELKFDLGTSEQVYGRRTDGPMPQTFAITASYAAADGRQFSEKTTIDLRVFYQATSGTHLVAERLESIAEAITGLAGKQQA